MLSLPSSRKADVNLTTTTSPSYPKRGLILPQCDCGIISSSFLHDDFQGFACANRLTPSRENPLLLLTRWGERGERGGEISAQRIQHQGRLDDSRPADASDPQKIRLRSDLKCFHLPSWVYRLVSRGRCCHGRQHGTSPGMADPKHPGAVSRTLSETEAD